MPNSPPKLHLGWNSGNKTAHKGERWSMLNGNDFAFVAPQF